MRIFEVISDEYTLRTKDGRVITFEYIDHDRENKKNPNWLYQRINAFVEGQPAGYLKIAYIPMSWFKKNYPTILNWYHKHTGRRLFPQIGTSLEDFGYNDSVHYNKLSDDDLRGIMKGYYSPQSIDVAHLSREQLLVGVKDIEKRIKKTHGDQFRKFVAYHVDKPEPDYINVEPEYKGQGVGRALYLAAARWYAKQGLRFYQSDTQTQDARAAWSRLEGQGRAAKDGERYYVIPEGVMRVHEIISEADVWHGSPHKFDQFTLNRVGHGEGNQMFGWGLYFASKREVAEFYQKNVKNAWEGKPRRYFLGQELEPGTPEYQAASLLDDVSLASLKKEVNGWIKDAKPGEDLERYRKIAYFLDRASSKKEFQKKPPRQYLYSVEIPDNHYLLWDVELGKQQPQVKAALTKMLTTTPTMVENPEILTGEQFYGVLTDRLGDQRQASLALLDAGIMGIKYLDGTSRARGKGSFNYVVFDDTRVKIKGVESK
jgi:GNAT superfamily N-acetyltransferase